MLPHEPQRRVTSSGDTRALRDRGAPPTARGLLPTRRMAPPLDEITMLGKLVLSLSLSGVVGWERETHAGSAGVRTYMLVGLGSCTFALLTRSIYAELAAGLIQSGMDPLRVVESVAGGVGFLGAGCIIQARGSVIGLTTAAGIWVVGSVGVSCAMGYSTLAVATTLLALFVLRGVGALEERFKRARAHGQPEVTETSSFPSSSAR